MELTNDFKLFLLKSVINETLQKRKKKKVGQRVREKIISLLTIAMFYHAKEACSDEQCKQDHISEMYQGDDIERKGQQGCFFISEKGKESAIS